MILSITAVTTRVRGNNWTDIYRVFITTPSMAIILHRKPVYIGTPPDIRGGAHDSNQENKLYITNGHVIVMYHNTKHTQRTQSIRNKREDTKKGRSEIETTFVETVTYEKLWRNFAKG
jgi:hypothetical protein